MHKPFRPARFVLFLAVAGVLALAALAVAGVPGTPAAAATHSARYSHNGNPPGTPTAQPTATTAPGSVRGPQPLNGNPPGATLPFTGGAVPGQGSSSGLWFPISMGVLLFLVGALLLRSRKR